MTNPTTFEANDKMNFSVLISVYARENPVFFARALKSIYDDQTLKPNEIVLVEDGPLTPELDKVVIDFIEKHNNVLKVVSLDKNVGLGSALNRGLHECSNEIVARMDSDDISLSSRFEKQYAFLSKNLNISVIGSSIEEFNESPHDLGRFRILPEKNEEIRKIAKFRSPLNHPTVMYRKSHVISVGGYLDSRCVEDYGLWIRMLKNGYRLHNLRCVHLFYRAGERVMRRRLGFKYLIAEMRLFIDMYEERFLTFAELMLNLIVRLPLRFLPSRMLGLIYMRFLRKSSV